MSYKFQNEDWDKLSERQKRKIMRQGLSGRHHKNSPGWLVGFFVFLALLGVLAVLLA